MPPKLLILATSIGVSLLLERLDPALSIRHSHAWTIATLASIQFLLWLIWRVILYPKLFSPLRHLPGPPGGTFLHGQAWNIHKLPSGQPMRDWIDTVPNDGLIRYTNWFNMERVLLTNPKTLAEVLSTKNYEFIKPAHFISALGRILGVGVLLAEGNEHKQQRKNLMPAFAYRHIKDLCPLFWEKSMEMVNGISAAIKEPGEAKEETFNIIEAGEWGSRATLDIIGMAGMGRDFGAIKDPLNPLNQTYRSVFNPPRSARYMQLAGMFIPLWFLRRLPLKRNGELEAASAIIKQTCRDLIVQKKEKMEKGAATEIDILSVALESGGFSDENLVSQMMTFLAAGHETTSSAFTWTLYFLCKYPEVQRKMREEIHEKLTSPRKTGQPVTAADLDACHYTHAVCNEVLRILPPVAMTMRVAAHNSTINGHFIPKDTIVVSEYHSINP